MLTSTDSKMKKYLQNASYATSAPWSVLLKR